MSFEGVKLIEQARLKGSSSLDLSGLGLCEVPFELMQLSNLQRLNLSSNYLSEVPRELAYLSKLRQLYLNDNVLEGIPNDLANLNELQTLDLSNNELREIPRGLAYLDNLLFFYVGGNPLQYPPEIVEGGDREVLAYLQALAGANREWISKMVVVGEGGVGKSSLLRALRNEAYVEGLETTHGIEVKALPLAHPKQHEVTMQLNTWDFGGQEIYHATHQFFLTNRSLYILAWNARLGYEQGKLNYWLDTIHVRAPQSPIILVATYKDERDAVLPLVELQKNYPNIVGSVEISNKSGEGIEKLRQLVMDTAAALPLMGEEWPEAWANVRHVVRELAKARNHITPNELAALLGQQNVTGMQARVLIKWLHELGEILFFQDEPELNDTVILNSQWVTEAMSRVLESDEVIQRVGIFSREHMDQLWSDLPPAMRDHFLRLMEQFDLSYRILEDTDKSLVIERVPYDPPRYEPKWEAQKECAPCREIKMRFVLDATMPAGIPTWFIARSHRFTQRTHWRHGAMFGDNRKTPNHLALIQAYPHDRYVSLAVRGPAPQNFFALMRDGLEVTFNRFPGLGVTRKVPCCCQQDGKCSYEFDLSHLEKRLERGKNKIECNLSGEDVSVAQMLLGIDYNTTERLMNEMLKKQDEFSLELKEFREYQQREFTKLFNAEQNKDEARSPYVFVIRDGSYESDLQGLFSGTGIRGGFWQQLGEYWKRKVELQLYCQMPGHWHPCGYERGKDDPATGLYQIELNAELAAVLAQHLPKLVKLLKFARPVAQVGMALQGIPPIVPDPEKLADRIKDDYEKMEKFAKSIEATSDAKMLKGLGDAHGATEASGPLLRNLRQLLEAKDPNRTWGGLTRYLTKEGHHLWLCPEHLAQYKQ